MFHSYIESYRHVDPYHKQCATVVSTPVTPSVTARLHPCGTFGSGGGAMGDCSVRSFHSQFE